MLNIVKLRNELDYDPETGVFKWKRPGRGRRKSLIAGCLKKQGINVWRRIVFDQQEYCSGRLAWAYMTGELPEFIVDHIDGDALNDAWGNLRRGDNCQDQRNARLNHRSTTGIPGVNWYAKSNAYRVTIGAGKKTAKYLGWVDDFFEACCLRKRAERDLNYGEFHGTVVKSSREETL